MPIFEYVCRTCHHRFETIVNGSKTPACPACDSAALDKQLSVFAVSTNARRGSSLPATSPCAQCGHPDGPGACRLN